MGFVGVDVAKGYYSMGTQDRGPGKEFGNVSWVTWWELDGARCPDLFLSVSWMVSWNLFGRQETHCAYPHFAFVVVVDCSGIGKDRTVNWHYW